MTNQKPDSHTARKNFPGLAVLVTAVVLLIALAYIYHLNGFGEASQAKATSTIPVTETLTATLAPSPVPTNTLTPTPEPTKTPEASYNCPFDPEASNMSVISIEKDIKTGDLAKYIERQLAKVGQVSANPSGLNYITHDPGDGTISLNADQKGPPETGVARHTIGIGLCKLPSAELGLKNKNGLYLILSGTQGNDGILVPQITLATHTQVVEMVKNGWLTDPGHVITPRYKMGSVFIADLLETGNKRGDAGDFQIDLGGSKLLTAQNIDPAVAKAVYDDIALHDFFSPQDIQFFKMTIQYTGITPNRNP